MAKDTAGKKLTEEELFFFEDQVCGEADLVYRFCIALCMQQDQAFQFLRTTLREVAGRLGGLVNQSSSDLRTALLKTAFGVVGQAGSGSGDASSPLFQGLKKLPKDVRAVLVARDLAGLNISQIGDVIGQGQDSVLAKLAEGRRSMVQVLG